MALRNPRIPLRRVVIAALSMLVILTVVLLVAARRAAAPTVPGPSATATAAVVAGYPGVASTGVPAGTRLKASAGLTVSTDGAVLEGLDIHGCVDIKASHVTLRNSRVSGGGCAFAQVTVESGASGTVIEDSEIDGQNQTEVRNDGAGICCGGYTALRLNIHGNVDGAIVGGGSGTTIMDSWIHDLHRAADSHNQDILSNGGSAALVVRHNRLENQLDEVGTVSLFGDFAAVQNVTIDDNLLSGGGFTIYGGCEPEKRFGNQCRNIAIINNRFMRAPQPGGFFPTGGHFGAVTSFNGRPVGVAGDDPGYRAAHQLQWSGNVWNDNGAALVP